MLPANVGTVNPKREVPKTMSPVKSFSNKATATVKQPEEMRFVPIAPKPAKPSPVPPLIQLVSNGPNGNASSLISILTPKTLLNPTCTKTNVQTVVPTQANPQLQLQSQPQPQPQAQTQAPTVTATAPGTGTAYAHTIGHHAGYHADPATTTTAASTTKTATAAATTTTTNAAAPQQLQPNAAIHNSAIHSSGTAAVSTQTHLINMVAAKGSLKAAAAAPAQISLLAKKQTPVILSKAAVEKIRLKFGQVQAQANSGALVLTKPLKANQNGGQNANNNRSNNSNNLNSKPPPGTGSSCMPTATNTALMPPLVPSSMPTSMAMATNALPEIKITPLPAAPTNSTKIMKVQPSPLAVIVPVTPVTPVTPAPPLAPTVAPIMPAGTPITTISKLTQPSEQLGSPKLQRSKSLAGSEENATIILLQNNAAERRHSVAIMAKEVDVVEQPTHIETITIDDDDSEEEKEAEERRKQQQQQQQQQQQKQQRLQQVATPIISVSASRKNSTASRSSSIASSCSSDVEMIILPCSKPEEPKQPKQQPLEIKHPGNGAIINIVKAETLPVSKEEFEKSLRCDELLENSSPLSVCASNVGKSGTITVTPIARLQKTKSADLVPNVAFALNAFRRSMQQSFSMLRWRDQQPSVLQNSKMRFELNRYNLLQLAERCEPRHGPAEYFEKSLFDRPVRRPNSSSDPLLYLCSRCNCHGPASDFLAPRFCSISCVRRVPKRRHLNPPSAASENKISRMEPKATNGHVKHLPQHHQQLQQLQQQQQQQIQEQHSQLQQQNREKERNREPKLNESKPIFIWSEYLKMKGNGGAAPVNLFPNPFPIGQNQFKLGMKLEAIDPENCSLFCVCTIVEVRGYRLKLNFDGYPSMYDFWVNADSMDIFPPGWCERTSRVLQAPKGYCPDKFNWYRYLLKTNAEAAPSTLFTHLKTSSHTHINDFRVGMHLEAEDLNDTGKICVATVADILDERIRVHFDGWDDCYDFWVHINSPYIHPCGWHDGRQQLIVPPDYQNVTFNWASYIEETGGIAAPERLFRPREPMEFQARMKLEVVDQRNPCLIRPATVITRKGYRIQLHLDCWPAEYYFWLEDDSTDLHPVGWCQATSHDLEAPPSFRQGPPLMPCDVPGCRGFGNAKRFNLNMHALRDCCPYAPDNWRQWRAKTVKPPRVLPEHIKRADSPMPQSPSPSPSPSMSQSQSQSSSLSPSLSSSPSQSRSSPRPQPHAQTSTDPLPGSAAQLNTNSKLVSARGHMLQKVDTPRPSLDSKPPANMRSDVKTPLPTDTEVKTAPAGQGELNPRCLAIAKSIVTDYGPHLARNYRLWQRNSDFDMTQLKSNPLYWTNWDVYEFVERALKSSTIAKMLFDEEIDGRALLMLGRKDLATYFKLKVGPTVKLFSLIVNLRIAVECKFQTKETGLNFKQLKKSIRIAKREPLKNSPKPYEDNSNNLEQNNVLDRSPEKQEEDSEEEESEEGEEEEEVEEEEVEADDEDDADFEFKEEPDEELTDDEDVVLDNEDFLCVKPIPEINKNEAVDEKDADVIMTTVDALPVSAS
ncbi:LOW QUALITY PROTEIN: uncharacterized protein LOC115561955 [Drosophila navojoa]|uniref:LOW QUALITY PROTEIN: uncharacterized protein LOC115561955 n=1 Tax=Drosophila navojoa TaxID=7232 RepID=UPI0011BDCC44|nr:LOW QUALITY PROTEIN: uncharacterized protein LOC115561955 [Drosophila navojoa]